MKGKEHENLFNSEQWNKLKLCYTLFGLLLIFDEELPENLDENSVKSFFSMDRPFMIGFIKKSKDDYKIFWKTTTEEIYCFFVGVNIEPSFKRLIKIIITEIKDGRTGKKLL